MQEGARGPVTSTAETAALLPPPGKRRRIDLHRRRAIVSSDRIDVRPSRTAIIPPLFGFFCGLVCVGLIILGVTRNALPYWLLALLLLFALFAVPLSGITFVYALIGASVIVDRRKQSATWQQGLLGMGIGTTELVPFWKIAEILVTEAGGEGSISGSRTEEFAQWEAVLLKKSGRRLRIAGMTVPRQFASAGFAPVRELADAIGAITGALVRYEGEPMTAPTAVPDETTEPPAASPETAGPVSRGPVVPRLPPSLPGRPAKSVRRGARNRR